MCEQVYLAIERDNIHHSQKVLAVFADKADAAVFVATHVWNAVTGGTEYDGTLVGCDVAQKGSEWFIYDGGFHDVTLYTLYLEEHEVYQGRINFPKEVASEHNDG